MRHFKGELPLKLIGADSGKEYKIRMASKSGGKAGKGKNKTSTVQVIYDNCLMVKQIRFTVADHESKMTAIEKAIEYVAGKKVASQYFSDSNAIPVAESIDGTAFAD